MNETGSAGQVESETSRQAPSLTASRRLPTAILREVAVAARVDPRTVAKAYAGKRVCGPAGARAYAALVSAGYAVSPSPSSPPSVFETVVVWWQRTPLDRRPREFTVLDVAEVALRLTSEQVDRRVRALIGCALRKVGLRGALRRTPRGRMLVYTSCDDDSRRVYPAFRSAP